MLMLLYSLMQKKYRQFSYEKTSVVLPNKMIIKIPFCFIQEIRSLCSESYNFTDRRFRAVKCPLRQDEAQTTDCPL